MLEKLRAFADIGRTQGITATASIVIVGALTSTVRVEWYHIVYFTILSCFAHMALNTRIALGDIEGAIGELAEEDRELVLGALGVLIVDLRDSFVVHSSDNIQLISYRNIEAGKIDAPEWIRYDLEKIIEIGRNTLKKTVHLRDVFNRSTCSLRL